MAQKPIERDGLLERGTSNGGTYRLYLFRNRQGIANMFFRHTSPGFVHNVG
jgi:hypothetical protein